MEDPFRDAVIKEVKSEYDFHLEPEVEQEREAEGMSPEGISLFRKKLEEARDSVDEDNPLVTAICEAAEQILMDGLDEEVSRLLPEEPE